MSDAASALDNMPPPMPPPPSALDQPVASSPLPAPPLAFTPRLVEVARSEYETWNGTLEARVEAFVAALAAHAMTINVPAPCEGPLVELLARSGGVSALVIRDDVGPPQGVNVPSTVTNWQARDELLSRPSLAGRDRLFDDVDAALLDAVGEARAAVEAAKAAGDVAAEAPAAETLREARGAWQAWEYANVIGRDGALVRIMAARLGFDDAALDDFFRSAAKRGA